MKKIDAIVISKNAPKNTNVFWYDTTSLHAFIGGEWKEVSSGGGVLDDSILSSIIVQDFNNDFNNDFAI